MKLMNLGFDDDSCPFPTDADAPVLRGSAKPVYADDISKEEVNKEDLEIVKKAKRFNELKLISGNKLDVPLDEYVKREYGKRGVQRLSLARFVMKTLNYVPSDDVLLTLSCTKHARIVIATAGAGKTTSLQVDLAISKLIDVALGENKLLPDVVEGTDVEVPVILYLNYNKHNVVPILERHQQVCRMVNAAVSEQINDSIESSTVHAFCLKWLKAVSDEVDLPELNIIKDDEKHKIWEAIVTPRWTKFYGDDACTLDFMVLDDLYNFKTESLQDWEEFFLTAKFVDSGLKADFVKACLKKYESMKKQMRLIDFTDYLLLLIQVLKEHPEFKLKLQKRYRIIVADENQDFTALMNELLLQLYNPELNQLVVVGDPDQTIYEFKGVSPDNVVGLYARLKDVELLGLDTNYRCPDNVVEAAKRLLAMNVLRFEKPINTVKTGGALVKHPIVAPNSQDKAVLAELRKRGSAAYGSTVITYRNNNSSVILAEELYYAGIPFNILDSRRPFNNPVFRHLLGALKALRDKDDAEANRELYRFLPVNKDVWCKILDANKEKRRNHLHDLIVPQDLPKGTMNALKILVGISVQVESAPVSTFIAVLVKLYRLYYFDFMTRTVNPMSLEQENFKLYLQRALKFFERPLSLEYMLTELKERNIDSPDGVTLSTFHGLKGLEFDYVYAIDFNETLFPNFNSIEQKYSLNTAMEEKESETRLCYMLATRAIKELHLFYNGLDPSCYVSILCPKEGDEEDTLNSEDEVMLGTVSTASSEEFSAKLRFIQRLTGGRG